MNKKGFPPRHATNLDCAGDPELAMHTQCTTVDSMKRNQLVIDMDPTPGLREQLEAEAKVAAEKLGIRMPVTSYARMILMKSGERAQFQAKQFSAPDTFNKAAAIQYQLRNKKPKKGKR